MPQLLYHLGVAALHPKDIVERDASHVASHCSVNCSFRCPVRSVAPHWPACSSCDTEELLIAMVTCRTTMAPNHISILSLSCIYSLHRSQQEPAEDARSEVSLTAPAHDTTVSVCGNKHEACLKVSVCVQSTEQQNTRAGAGR